MKITDKRKKYYQKIYVYKQRREGYKAEGRKENYYQCTKKISQWNQGIRRLDERTSVINKIILAINEFFEVDIKSRVLNTTHKLARNVFYKYGMENGIQGAFLSLALGRSRKKTASECRLRFTRSFAKNSKNKAVFHKFSDYIKKDWQIS